MKPRIQDDRSLQRFVEAIALGEIADIVFEQERQRLGLPRADYASPLLAIAAAQAEIHSLN